MDVKLHIQIFEFHDGCVVIHLLKLKIQSWGLFIYECYVNNNKYVHCLNLIGPQTLYIATNQCHIHHVELLET